MEQLIEFFGKYGLAVTLIAIAGIIILGVMKYCNLFKKIEESKRHYIYLAISVGLSIIGTMVYLAIVHQFEVQYVFAIAAAIWVLNQTFYNIFKVTPARELVKKLLDWIVSSAKKKE